MPLLSLPHELLHHIAFLLAASTPLGPPAQLVPLYLTCSQLYACLHAPALLARVFRFKFDAGAVERRAFKPSLEGMKEMLEVWCRTLAFVRVFARQKRNYEDVEQESGEPWDMDMDIHLHNCLFMMLDNDGKNYAQLKHAGVHLFVDYYLRYCIWDPSIPFSQQLPTSSGWPIDTPTSSAAVLLYWLTLERCTLLTMPIPRREELVRVLLPFVVMPFRYAGTEAPPNHFELPLVLEDGQKKRKQQKPLAFYLPGVVEDALASASTVPTSSPNLQDPPSQTPTQPPPTYPHYPLAHSRTLAPVYFLSRPEMSMPPTAIGAKLLFVALKEVRKLMVPPVLPPGFRREHYAVLGADLGEAGAGVPGSQDSSQSQSQSERMTFADRGKAARLPRGASWDWENGVARSVNPDYVPASSASVSSITTASSSMWSPTPPPGSGPNESYESFSKEKEKDATTTTIITASDPESAKWDPTYWRMRLCADLAAPRPVFAPGEVYNVGSVGGVHGRAKTGGAWIGKIYIPQGIQYNHLLAHTPTYPGPLPRPSTSSSSAPAPQTPLFGRAQDEGGFYETGFSEASLGLAMQHIFVDLREHVRVCGCVGAGVDGVGGGECCGSIPTPELVPRVWDEVGELEGQREEEDEQREREGQGQGRRARGRGRQPQRERDQTAAPPIDHVPEPQDPALGQGDAHGPEQGPRPPTHQPIPVPPMQVAEIDAQFEALNDVGVNAVDVRGRTLGGQGAIASRAGVGVGAGGVGSRSRSRRAVGGGRVVDPDQVEDDDDVIDIDEEEEEEEQDDDEDGEQETLPTLVDMSMCNAWFPGPIGGVKWVERDPMPVVSGLKNERGAGHGSLDADLIPIPSEGGETEIKENGKGKIQRRREIVFNSGFEEPDAMKEDVCVRFREEALGLEAGSFDASVSGSATFSTSSSALLSSSPLSSSTAGAGAATYNPTAQKVLSEMMRTTENKSTTRNGWVYETWDGERVSLHDLGSSCDDDDGAAPHNARRYNSHCVTCVAFEEAKKVQREREAGVARRVLDRVMRGLNSPSNSSGSSPSSHGLEMQVDSIEEEDDDDDVDVDMEDLDMDSTMAGFDEAIEGVVRDARERMDIDLDPEEEEEEEQEQEAQHRVEVFGDDEHVEKHGYWVHHHKFTTTTTKSKTNPNPRSASSNSNTKGRPSSTSSPSSSTTPENTLPHPPTSTYIHPTRRSHSRSRIGVGCTAGVGDIVLTGETAPGDAYRTWQAPARFYGRVRKWDGLVGILRCATVPPINYIFIFGYIVGENNFVGEWRVAGADPLRPVWGSAIVMSRREEPEEC